MMYKLFISFLLTLLCGVAQAEMVYVNSISPAIYGSSPEEVCRASAARRGITFNVASGGNCWGGSSGSQYDSYFYVNRPDCAAGTKRDSTGACVPTGPDCSSKLPIIRKFEYTKGKPAKPPGSFGGCAVSADELLTCRATATGSYCMWQVTRTGAQQSDEPAGSGSTGTDSPADPKDPATTSPPLPSDSKGNCPAGAVQAGMDSSGTPICIGTGTHPEGTGTSSSKDTRPTSTVTQNSTDAAGQPVETTRTTTTNSDGSVTTTTTVTTTAPDGSKSVSGSSSTGPTPGGKQGNPDPQKDDFCVQHPDLTACRNSSVSGTCGTISCQGDAIQCATLRAAAAMQCAQQQDADALKAMPSKVLGDAIMSGADPMKVQIDAAIKGTEVDLSKPALDQNGFLGGGSCLPDKTFTVMGRAVTVSFARVCADIQPLRTIIMACAFIVAYLIVSRSVLTS